jgi:hypothetical protein
MEGWTTAWLLWIGMFLAIEVPAILNKRPGDTLSEHAWRWFSVQGKATGWRARRFVLLAFLAWLSAHLLTGGKF